MNFDEILISPDKTHHLFEGQPVYEKRFLSVGPFVFPGLAAVTDETGSYHINFFGEEMYFERYACTGNFSDEVALVKNFSDEFFFIDESGRPIGFEKYFFATEFSDGIAVVYHKTFGATHITNAGELLYGDWYFDARPFQDGRALVRDDDGWFLINKNGEKISDAAPLKNDNFPNGFVRYIQQKNLIPEILKTKVYESCAVLIRHSERSPFIKGQLGSTKGLTTRGKNMAYEFGRALPLAKLNMYASPVPRCVETAEKILEGSEHLGEVFQDTFLGAPGAYVSDPNLTIGFYVENPVKVMSLKYIESGTLPGHYPIEIGTKRLLNFVLGTMREGEVSVCVTHDAFLAPFIASLTGYDFTDDWTGFLDGCVIMRREGAYWIWWRGRETEIGCNFD